MNTFRNTFVLVMRRLIGMALFITFSISIVTEVNDELLLIILIKWVLTKTWGILLKLLLSTIKVSITCIAIYIVVYIWKHSYIYHKYSRKEN